MEDMYRQFFGVLLVLGILIGAVYLLKQRGLARFTGMRVLSGQERVMKVVERIPLTAQHAVHLVQIGQRRVLIASSPQSCELITEISERDTPPQAMQ
jgi:flagellar biosynthetic protein FliO